MMEKRIENIAAMENRLNRLRETLDEPEAVLEKLRAQEADAKELFDYYGSKQWFDDRDADEKGLLPSDLPRGVLTEDAVYDVLTDYMRLLGEDK